MIKKLPRKPQETNTKNWKSISVSIPIHKIYGCTIEDLDEIYNWLEKENVCVAWDGRYWINSNDMEFTYLLEKSWKK